MEITDSDIGGIHDPDMKYSIRKAVRTIVQRADKKIALLYVANDQYHKLPWWGIDFGEDQHSALDREVFEEVGCAIAERTPLGTIVEYRQWFEQLQINHCYFCTTQDTIFAPQFTARELSEGFCLKWNTPDEALAQMKSESPEPYHAKFFNYRDVRFLEYCIANSLFSPDN
jgi:ADP-ribose pyrophosphatase YjhB (NUDIX family)